MKPTLLILAAGMASRYGSMKQIQSFGPSRETIMDYSIYDAIRAGFTKVVFIIRKDFAEAFQGNFDKKLNGKVEIEYVYQEMDSYVKSEDVPSDRTKPWGTAHAVLCAQPVVKDPFAVINADDFYGQDAFVKACNFTHDNKENLKAEFFIPIVADYFIKNEGGSINAIPTSAQWFGVTYKEDAPSVKADLDALIKDKIYPSSLWNV